MLVKDFVRQSIVEIHEAIWEAQEKLWEHEMADRSLGKINPSTHGARLPARNDLREIEFDLAVTAMETVESTKGGGLKAGIEVLGIHAGLEQASSQSTQSVSRIKFSVPVLLPGERASRKRDNT